MRPAFAWTSGELHGDVLLGAGLLAVAYAVAWARGPRRRAGEPVRFFAGLGVLLLALNGWHLPLPYDQALERHGWHVVEHLVLLATSVLGWWPVVSASTLAPRLPYGAQILYLFAFGIPMTVVAAMITGAERVLYPF